MLQEQEMGFTQTFAYEKKGNSAVIRRCFSRDTKVVIPERIDGLLVTEIGAYAFSAHLDEAAFQKDLEDGKIRMTRSVLDKELPPVLDGQKLEEIVFPLSVIRVGRYCFYNCDHLKKLSFGDRLKDWGSGVFTGCHHIRQICMAVCGDGSSMLKDMLDEIREELCVDYIELPEKELATGAEEKEKERVELKSDPEKPYRAPVTARLMFPEFYEEGVENTPARILETHVHGSGILYRNCFQGRKIDFYQYDNAFPYAQAQESEEFLMQLVIGRLRYPKGLNEGARGKYLCFLQTHVRDYAEFLVKKHLIDEIRWMCGALKNRQKNIEAGCGQMAGNAPGRFPDARTAENLPGHFPDAHTAGNPPDCFPDAHTAENPLGCFLDALTEAAGRKQNAEVLSFVMDYRHGSRTPVKRRARLEL